MEKITLIVSNLVNSVQVVADVLINLVFQPVFAVLTIIQSLISIWSGEEEPDEISEQPQYPEIPVVNGFHTNTKEQAEIEKIKEQLNQ